MLRKDENNRTSVRHYARPTFAYRNESDEIEEVREEPAVNCPLASMPHELVRSGVTPTRPYEKKCQKCSMLNLCMPKTTGSHRSVRSYLAASLGR